MSLPLEQLKCVINVFVVTVVCVAIVVLLSFTRRIIWANLCSTKVDNPLAKNVAPWVEPVSVCCCISLPLLFSTIHYRSYSPSKCTWYPPFGRVSHTSRGVLITIILIKLRFDISKRRKILFAFTFDVICKILIWSYDVWCHCTHTDGARLVFRI